MIESVRHSSPSPANDATSCFLAADVGGTHARIGLVAAASAGAPLELLHYRSYVCADHPGLEDILAAFASSVSEQGYAMSAVTGCAIACAGYVLDDHIVNVNLPWKASIGAIRRRLGLASLAVINDFEALAYAMPTLREADSIGLLGAAPTDAAAPMLVMGPGTGLGCAVVIPSRHGPSVLPTEAGQIGFAPGTADEAAVLARLYEEREHVAVEHLLSGPGLLNIYRALAAHRGVPATLSAPAEVTAQALADSDPLASAAVQMFCAVLGSFAADLAVLYGARGGVYLAGGILPRLVDFLPRSDFRERFYRKGVMRPWLEQVPVRLIEHGRLGVIGVAHWFQRQPINV